jgi:hypothetical protein
MWGSAGAFIWVLRFLSAQMHTPGKVLGLDVIHDFYDALLWYQTHDVRSSA